MAPLIVPVLYNKVHEVITMYRFGSVKAHLSELKTVISPMPFSVEFRIQFGREYVHHILCMGFLYDSSRLMYNSSFIIMMFTFLCPLPLLFISHKNCNYTRELGT